MRYISYTNGRTGENLFAHVECIKPLANPPKCNTQSLGLPGWRDHSEDQRFTYDPEMWGHDKYTFDGKEGNFVNMKELGPSGNNCDELCKKAGSETQSQQPVGGGYNMKVQIEPGL